MNQVKSYTTDNKGVHKSKGNDIVEKIGLVLGKKFLDYRERWDKVNKLELPKSY